MKKLSALMVGAALVCALQAKADLVKIGSPFESGGNSSPTEEAQLLKEKLGLSYTPTFLAKFEDSGASTGDYVDNFDVDIDGTEAPSSWDLTGTGYDLVYALVKAGRYYQIYGVKDGSNQDVIGDWVIESPDGTGPNGQTQNISHVSFFGRMSNGVPDGGLTAMLLGFGLAGLGVGRRLIRK